MSVPPATAGALELAPAVPFLGFVPQSILRTAELLSPDLSWIADEVIDMLVRHLRRNEVPDPKDMLASLRLPPGTVLRAMRASAPDPERRKALLNREGAGTLLVFGRFLWSRVGLSWRT